MTYPVLCPKCYRPMVSEHNRTCLVCPSDKEPPRVDTGVYHRKEYPLFEGWPLIHNNDKPKED